MHKSKSDNKPHITLRGYDNGHGICVMHAYPGGQSVVWGTAGRSWSGREVSGYCDVLGSYRKFQPFKRLLTYLSFTRYLIDTCSLILCSRLPRG
jgi:hypothetical protein